MYSWLVWALLFSRYMNYVHRYLFFLFSDDHKIRQINPSQTLINFTVVYLPVFIEP